MSQLKTIQRLFASHAAALRVFFRKRTAEDALDLTQEVYLRLLRSAASREIHNPEAYLFTVANNLLKERFVMQRREAAQVDLADPVAAQQIALQSLLEQQDIGAGLDRERQMRGLRAVLPALPPRTRLVLFLTFEKELSLQQVAQRLGVSKTMVHKLLAQALNACREHMIKQEQS